ncbi:hypothetical protein BGZ81_003493, partial [Podila clonocystis]
ALSLPEIVYRIGWFLPLWKPVPADSTSLAFHPKDLVASIQVSRAWHSILLPLLWKVYDDKAMEHCKISQFDHINLHCRYLKLLTTTSSGRIRPDNLKSLEVSDTANMDHAMGVLRSNPHLQHIHWRHSSELEPVRPNPAPQDFFHTLESSFSQLKILTICGTWICSPDQFMRIVRRNASLIRLDLMCCRGLEESDAWTAMPSVRGLTLGSPWEENPGTVQLLRHLTNLEALTIILDPHCPFTKVSEALKVAGTNLKVLRIAQDNTVRIINASEMTGALISSVPKLPYLDLRIRSHPKPLLRFKILDIHSEWLRTVMLWFSDNTIGSLSSANKILTSCPKLEKFSLGLWSGPRLPLTKTWPAVTFWALFKEPWNCPRLGSLALNDFVDLTALYWETYGSGFLDTLASQGWTFVQKEARQDQQTTVPRPYPNLVIVEKVLTQVAKTQLRMFEVNQIKFVKNSA